MKYNTKSVILGRKKRSNPDDTKHPLFISLFTMNDPHKSGQVPDQIIDFPLIDRVDITGLDVIYLLGGNDLVINNLEYIEVETDKNYRVYIRGKQVKK
ncbi:hypothetical protein HYY69_00295 [Candidatus Woesearchaeota archaeon]|nr:hypothetical protein [Candidatus Woesearchaeota archaeon]